MQGWYKKPCFNICSPAQPLSCKEISIIVYTEKFYLNLALKTSLSEVLKGLTGSVSIKNNIVSFFGVIVLLLKIVK